MKETFETRRNWDRGDYKEFLDTSIGGMSTYELRGDEIRTLHFSKGLAMATGFSIEEYEKLVMKDALAIIAEEDRERFWMLSKAAVAKNEPINTSFRVKTKSGVNIWVHINAKVMEQQGDTYFIQAYFVAMAAETKLYFDIVNQSSNGIYIIAKSNHKLLYLNQALESMLKSYGVKKIIGEKCYKVLCGKKTICENCTIYAGKPVEYYVEMVHKYYSTISHDIIWDGIPASVIYVTDISAQKEAMEEITRIYNNIPGAAFRCRFDPEWTVISANDGFYSFLGYTKEEFRAMGNTMESVIYPPDQEVMAEKIGAQLTDGRNYVENENRLVCKDGSVKWISIKAQLLADEEGKEFFYCLFVDITKQKLEEAISDNTRKNLNIALAHAKMYYWEYDFRTGEAAVNDALAENFQIPHILKNYPDSFLAMNFVSEEYAKEYLDNVTAMVHGAAYREFVAKIRTATEDYQWMKLRFTGVRNHGDEPIKAICTAEVINEYKELEERFTTILNQNGIENWVYDIPRHTIILNKGQHYTWQYDNRLEIGNIPETHIEERQIHPDDAEKLRQVYKRVEAGERTVTDVLRFWNVDEKSYRWKRCSYNVIVDKDNVPLYAIGSSMDVTARKEAEARYRASVEFREHTQAENQVLSAHCNITRNKVLELSDGTGGNLLDRFSDDRNQFFLGIGTFILDDAKRRRFYDTFLNEAAKRNFERGQTEVSFDCEAILDPTRRETYWIEIKMNIVQDPATMELEGFLSVLDKSEDKRQEAIIKAALWWDFDFVACMDLERDMVYSFMGNSEDASLLKQHSEVGRSYRKRYELTLEKAIPEEEKESYARHMSPEYILKEITEKGSFEFIYHVKLLGVMHAKRARMTSYSDNKNMIVFSQTDVTYMLKEQEKQRTLLENSLAAAEKANHAKSDFLNRISHDMRTPLNGILGLTALMEDKTDWKEIKQDLVQMRLSGKYLLNLINDTLDVAKIESGKMVLSPTVCEGKVLLNTVLSLLKPNLEAKNIKLKLELEPLPYTILYVDVARLQQLVMNILSNAIKFTPTGGTITVRAENLQNTATEIVDRFVIEDTGIGIDPKFLPHLFEPFSQENTSRTSRYQGTGLGMTITKKIVELMGGKISVKSTVGKGTTFDFTVHMPKATKEQIEQWQHKEEETVDLSILEGKHILVCEDHPLNAKIAKRLLEKHGLFVTIAKNGKEGLELFEKSKPYAYDLILMDVRMPVMDGLDATKHIRTLKRRDAAHIPIVAMTANALSEDVKECLASGMDAHIGKPFEPVQLYATVASFLKRHD